MSRATLLERDNTYVRARSCSSYPLSKKGKAFSSAAYRRSAPPRLALDRLKWRCLRGFGAARMISQCGKTGLIFLLVWRRAYSSSAAVDILDISVTQNASVVSNPRWHLLRAGGPGARRRSFYLTNKESTLDPRAARPVAERRPWGRKRRKHEALRRAFPERHTYLYAPARRSRTEGCRALALPRGPLPSGDLGTKAAETRGPPSSVSQSAILICMPLRGGAAQRGAGL